jgi:hypothetical protein
MCNSPLVPIQVVEITMQTLWSTVQEFITLADNKVVDWDSIRGLHFGDKVAIAIFDVSTFWITYLLQRNLGAILDLVQVVSLIGKSFTIRFMSPTPRQKIEWTAPTTFDCWLPHIYVRATLTMYIYRFYLLQLCEN